ncbi:phosphatase PAP2 family protein [Devosia pacifica]|uniref:Phosphatase PAP2 family protein n=1 Tax=Devosia pacifica TaxID=1335967 RepID=A0A918RT79_9HYPH|nr:phosphatase PAP2 family protein [Devosia pacifica]GHA10333.1 phosphatase PAP2 family protein [Devosia pacifica]
MIDLGQRWPFGLNRKTWPTHVNVVLIILFVALWFDAWLSQEMMAWPMVWRAPFFFITDYGLADWVLVSSVLMFVLGLAVFYLSRGLRRRAAMELTLLGGYLFVTVAGAGILTQILKRLFGRGRPPVFSDAGAFDFQRIFNDWTYQSFPSGHSTTALAFAFAIGFMSPRFFPLLLTLAVATGISRIAVGMHYPTDVIAGFVVGIAGAYIVRNLFARRRWLFVANGEGRVRFRGVPALRRVLRGYSRRIFR